MTCINRSSLFYFFASFLYLSFVWVAFWQLLNKRTYDIIWLKSVDCSSSTCQVLVVSAGRCYVLICWIKPRDADTDRTVVVATKTKIWHIWIEPGDSRRRISLSATEQYSVGAFEVEHHTCPHVDMGRFPSAFCMCIHTDSIAVRSPQLNKAIVDIGLRYRYYSRWISSKLSVRLSSVDRIYLAVM